MSGINSVVLVGRLTRDVEVRKTGSGVSYARFTVACDRRYSGGQNAQNSQQPTADFIGCVAWRQSADFLFVCPACTAVFLVSAVKLLLSGDLRQDIQPDSECSKYRKFRSIAACVYL